MEIGFTGTQQGMTERQRIAVGTLLDVLGKDSSGPVHHGDCIGADAEMHELAKERGLHVEIHPPSNPRKRAYLKGDVKWPEYAYRIRNQHIVDCADVLIATPAQDHEINRSGTWMTVHMAKRKGIRVLVVYPEGIIHETKAQRGIGTSTRAQAVARDS